MMDEAEYQAALERSEAARGDTARLEAFSDGIFAIAVTLLVLQIAVPELRTSQSLLRAFLHQWPAFLAYGISFVTILVMWINHDMIVRQIGHADHAFKVLNGALLMAITFVNYPTALLARYLTTAQARDAEVIYSGTYVVVAALFVALWFYARRGNRLIAAQADPRLVAAITHSYRLGPLVYLAAVLLAFASVQASVALNAASVLYWAIFGARALRGGSPRRAAVRDSPSS